MPEPKMQYQTIPFAPPSSPASKRFLPTQMPRADSKYWPIPSGKVSLEALKSRWVVHFKGQLDHLVIGAECSVPPRLGERRARVRCGCEPIVRHGPSTRSVRS